MIGQTFRAIIHHIKKLNVCWILHTQQSENEKEVTEIKKYIKDPKSLEKIEKEIKNLKIKIEEEKKIEESKKERDVEKEPPRTHPRFSQNFPYELTPYYENPGLIGKGGFARVFRVNRKKDNMEVAIKVPISMDQAIGKSFIKELENWTKLKHQNIVEIFDYNVLPIPYFEMELCNFSLRDHGKAHGDRKSCLAYF